MCLFQLILSPSIDLERLRNEWFVGENNVGNKAIVNHACVQRALARINTQCLYTAN